MCVLKSTTLYIRMPSNYTAPNFCKLILILFHSPRCWDYRHRTYHLVAITFVVTLFSFNEAALSVP